MGLQGNGMSQILLIDEGWNQCLATSRVGTFKSVGWSWTTTDTRSLMGARLSMANEILYGESIRSGKQDCQAHQQKQTIPQEGERTYDFMSVSKTSTIYFHSSQHGRGHRHSKTEE